MRSLWILEQFVESWRHHPGFQVDSFGNATFRGTVRTECGRLKQNYSTVVRIRRYGHEEGKVRIRKEAGFFAEFPHLDFFPPWDEYKVRGEDNALTISGHSVQLRKKYVVSILPVAAEGPHP